MMEILEIRVNALLVHLLLIIKLVSTVVRHPVLMGTMSQDLQILIIYVLSASHLVQLALDLQLPALPVIQVAQSQYSIIMGVFHLVQQDILK